MDKIFFSDLQLNGAKKLKKLKFALKMAIIPIFMTAKRATGQNGAVRFFSGTEHCMSNIAQKNFQLIIISWFSVICITNFIYNTKRAFFELKYVMSDLCYSAMKFFLLKMWQKYRVNKWLKPNFALFCEKSTYFSFYLLKKPFLG